MELALGLSVGIDVVGSDVEGLDVVGFHIVGLDVVDVDVVGFSVVLGLDGVDLDFADLKSCGVIFLLVCLFLFWSLMIWSSADVVSACHPGWSFPQCDLLNDLK